MTNLHGIIYAYHSYTALNELVKPRTSASLPFCSRYRLIDFALSSMTNSGVKDVGVVMQKNYQSLLDHLEGGKDWDLSRGSGGLSLMPPYGRHDSDVGEYRGCMEALGAMRSYIRHIKQDHIALFRGDLAINIDLKDVYRQHIKTGAELTAVCADKTFDSGSDGIRYIPEEDGVFARTMHLRHTSSLEGHSSTEVYIISKTLLLELLDWSQANSRIHFHRDAVAHYLRNGGKVGIYIHTGYAARICSVADYYAANLDMLKPQFRNDLFPEDRPIYTKGRSSVSTYYGSGAKVSNSLVADGCYINGEIENCVLFRGIRVNKGAKLKNCVILQDCIVGENAELTCIISDKDVIFTSDVKLRGNEILPITVPKGLTI